MWRIYDFIGSYKRQKSHLLTVTHENPEPDLTIKIKTQNKKQSRRSDAVLCFF